MASALFFMSNDELHINEVHVSHAFHLVGESMGRGHCGFRALGVTQGHLTCTPTLRGAAFIAPGSFHIPPS